MQYVIYNDDYLAHHGILGMKWGKKNGPPYPIAPGDHSASEQKAGWRKSLEKGAEGAKKAAAGAKAVAKKTVEAAKVLKAKHDVNAEERKVKKAVKEEQRAAKEKERLEKEKAEAIIKGDLDTAKKNLAAYSDQELNALINRYNTIEKLNNSGKSKIERGLEFVDKATKAANTVSSALEAGVKAYNTIHKVQNALDGGNRRILDMNKSNEVKKDVTERIYNVDKNGNQTLQKETITDKDNNKIIKNYTGKQNQSKKEDDKNKKATHSAIDEASEDELRGILADENFLEHHGIKGQKWGQRNGPPYPITPGNHSAAEKKLNRSNFGSEKEINHEVNDHPIRDAILLDAAMVTGNVLLAAAGFYSPKLIAYTAVGIGITTANAIGNSIAIKKEKAAFKKREVEDKLDKKTGFYLKNDKITTIEDDAQNTNIGRGRVSSNYHNNCVLCSVAYDLRRKGYDVFAGKAGRGYSSDEFMDWYKGAKQTNYGDANDYDRAFGIQPRMSRSEATELWNDVSVSLSKSKNSHGAIDVSWYGAYGSGHSMQYEVSKGKVTLLDAQSGKVYSNDTEIVDMISNTTGFIETTRLDNAEFDYKKYKDLVR